MPGVPASTAAQGVSEFRVRPLVDALARRPQCPDPATAAYFDGLLRAAASLPLTAEGFAFARNWVAGARRLWEGGEAGAALPDPNRPQEARRVMSQSVRSQPKCRFRRHPLIDPSCANGSRIFRLAER